MEYFVTGATGFLGGRLVAQLVEAGHDVVALARASSDVDGLPERVTVVEGDVTDRSSMRAPMAGVDGVFHLAARYVVGEDDVAAAERVNVGGTRTVLELVDELDVPRAVYTSSLAVNSDTGGAVVDESYRHEGPHLTTYDRTKWAAHYRVAEPMIEAGLPLVILMPGVIYGPGDTGPTRLLWEAALRGDLPAIPRRTGYCWGHVEDTATAHRLAMDRGTLGETYIVAGEPRTLVETFALAERLVGLDVPRTVPPAVFRGLAGLAALAERVATLPPMYRAEPLRSLAGVTYWGDNAKARRELGLEHRPLAEGFQAYLEALAADLDRHG